MFNSFARNAPGGETAAMNLYLFCRKGLVLLALILFPVLVTGMGDSDYTMSFSDEAAPQGGAVSVNFSFSHQAPSGVQGFSFGVCHDPSVLTHEAEGASSNFDYVANWSNNVEQLKQGGPPDFFQQNEESGGGNTVTELANCCFD